MGKNMGTLLSLIELGRFALEVAHAFQSGKITEEEMNATWKKMQFSLSHGVTFFEQALEKRRAQARKT